MGVGINITKEKFARDNILINFSFDSINDHCTLEEMFENRSADESMQLLMKQEAEKMLAEGYSQHQMDGKQYVFSKDEDNRYYMKELNPLNFFQRQLRSFQNYFLN